MGVSKNPTNSSIFSLLFSYWFIHNSSNSHPQNCKMRVQQNLIQGSSWKLKIPKHIWIRRIGKYKSDETLTGKQSSPSYEKLPKRGNCFPEPVITNLTQKRNRNLQSQEGRMNCNPCPPEQKKWLESSKIFFLCLGYLLSAFISLN